MQRPPYATLDLPSLAAHEVQDAINALIRNDKTPQVEALLLGFLNGTVQFYIRPKKMEDGVKSKVVFYYDGAPSQGFDSYEDAAAHARFQNACHAVAASTAGAGVDPSDIEDIVQLLAKRWGVKI